MANIQSAKKRSRQANSRNSLKSSQRASVRTMVKNVEEAIKESAKKWIMEAGLLIMVKYLGFLFTGSQSVSGYGALAELAQKYKETPS